MPENMLKDDAILIHQIKGTFSEQVRMDPCREQNAGITISKRLMQF